MHYLTRYKNKEGKVFFIQAFGGQELNWIIEDWLNEAPVMNEIGPGYAIGTELNGRPCCNS